MAGLFISLPFAKPKSADASRAGPAGAPSPSPPDASASRKKDPETGKTDRKAAPAAVAEAPAAPSKSSPPESVPCAPHAERIADLEARLDVYRLVLDRYEAQIESGEAKNISDLKRLVNPNDPAVLQLRDEITNAFHPYIYSEHFPTAAEMAVGRVNAIRTASVPVTFWLSYPEMLRVRAGDVMDKALLLASVLRALDAERVLVLVPENREIIVYYEFQANATLIDVTSGKIGASLPADRALADLTKQQKLLYAFSDREYTDYAEEPGSG